MNILIFIIILGVLIFVHELGHFLLAKWNNIRVDEFALGFPPTLWKKKYGETTYKLNAVPFGGYVKIFGENNESFDEITDSDTQRSFVHKKWWQQISVLVAGVVFNIIFAMILFSTTFLIGLPSVIDETNRDNAQDVRFGIAFVEPGSPAHTSGVTPGDAVVEISYVDESVLSPTVVTNFDEVQQFIIDSEGRTIALMLADNNGDTSTVFVTPVYNEESQRYMIGAGFDDIGEVRYGFFTAIGKGFTETITMTKLVATGLLSLIGDAFTGDAHIDQLSGPVGIVGLIGDARDLGMVYILTFTAFISLNLAVLNILPFPALDGGRVLFVIIETITGKKIPASVAGWVNTIGFGILILLMIVVTIFDVIKLF